MGDDGEVSIYDLSYCFMGILGAVTTMLINSAVSILTGGEEGSDATKAVKQGRGVPSSSQTIQVGVAAQHSSSPPGEHRTRQAWRWGGRRDYAAHVLTPYSLLLASSYLILLLHPPTMFT
ncbi:hypothetical protein Pmani_022743 [Petrolisthes manimaculis]|uniref:Uncharacterized protein n=1 Tax=Petrolisthes manimaculis TaxID=1843537 RepID=A0AAE1U448_9EUCA|nr:hypothetical protein Pmani_022743 [Petrolisthes manimaculis]